MPRNVVQFVAAAEPYSKSGVWRGYRAGGWSYGKAKAINTGAHGYTAASSAVAILGGIASQLELVMNRTILWSLLLVSGFTVARAADDEPQQLFAEPKKDWVWDQDKRFDFLIERLASLEASLDAVNASIAKTTGKKSFRQGEARRAEANNTLMDRKGGGPMAWNQFYGTNAEKFFYHPVDPNTTYRTDTLLRQMGSSQDDKVGAGVPASHSVPVHQRPPQWDYIYRANRDASSRAEEEARKLEGKTDALLERRFQLEQEQAELWARLAFRVIERLNIPRKPVLRFQLVGASTEPADIQRAQALQAAARFLSTALLVIDKAEKDQATALSSVREVISNARDSFEDALLEADAVAADVVDKNTALGKYVALAQLLDDTSNNLGESYDVAMEGDRAKDAARKDRFRGLLQRSLVEYAEILLALDELTDELKSKWAISIDKSNRLPSPSTAWDESTTASAGTATLKQSGATQHSSPLVDDTVYLCDMAESTAERVLKGRLSTWEVNGLTVEKGIFAHAPSELGYELPGFRRASLEGSVGLGRVNYHSKVQFRIYGDKRLLWESAVITQVDNTANSMTEDFKVDVSGVRRLCLVVDPLGSQNSDHSIWIDPRIIPRR